MTMKPILVLAAWAVAQAAFAQAAAPEPVQPRAAPNREARAVRLMQRFDLNRDGRILLEEMRSPSQRRMQRLDTSRDGRLSRSEFETVRRTPAKNGADRFAALDKNADGAIAADEWVATIDRRFGRLDRDRKGYLVAADLQPRGAGVTR